MTAYDRPARPGRTRPRQLRCTTRHQTRYRLARARLIGALADYAKAAANLETRPQLSAGDLLALTRGAICSLAEKAVDAEAARRGIQFPDWGRWSP